MGQIFAALILFGFFATPQEHVACKQVSELQCMSEHYGPDYCKWQRDQSREMCALP